jgi:hypothetical protein
MPSKQSEAVRRHWETSWRTMTEPGLPAATAHYRGGAYGLGVLTVTREGISRITVFDGGTAAVRRWGVRL